MTPTIKLRKSIIKDDPRDLVCYVTLSVLETTNIAPEIFVVTYVPPTTFNPEGYNVFHNVAYVDQLTDLPTTPEYNYKSSFIRSRSVTKSFSDYNAADTWCKEIYKEIQRLISTIDVAYEDATSTLVTITEDKYSEVIIPDDTDIDMTVDVSEPESSSSESSSSVEAESGADDDLELTLDLTFDGKEITI